MARRCRVRVVAHARPEFHPGPFGLSRLKIFAADAEDLEPVRVPRRSHRSPAAQQKQCEGVSRPVLSSGLRHELPFLGRSFLESDQNRLARPQRPPQAAEQGLAVIA